MIIQPARCVVTLGKVAWIMRGISSAVQVPTGGRPLMLTQSGWLAPSALSEGKTRIDGGMRPASIASLSRWGEAMPVTRDCGSPTQPCRPTRTL